MTRTVTDQLARSTEAELIEVRGQGSVLLHRAHALTVAARHDPDIALCADAGCLLADTDPGGQVCAVTHRLAGLVDGVEAVAPIDVALAGFLEALAGSFDAIRACRQTVHPSGRCWFSHVPGRDGCREILHLAHQLT